MCTHSDSQCALLFVTPWTVSLPGSSVHGIFKAGILELVAISFFKGFSKPRDWTHVSCTSCIGKRFLYHCDTWKPLTEFIIRFFLFPAKIFHCCFVHGEVKDVLIFPIFDGTTDTHDSLFPPSLVISSIFTTFFCSHLFALRLPVTNSKMCFI